MKKLFYSLSLVVLMLVFSSWGSTGHRIINSHAPASFPYVLNFLKSSWTTILAIHASDADDRKQIDPTESPKHYIDIENYDEFLTNGTIPISYDSARAIHGTSFITVNGTLPWTTVITYDTLVKCFQRHNFTKASLIASDLGHYVGDGHQPLHITRNFDGDMTGQGGIHGTYETSMVERYESQLVYPDDSATLITDVPGYIFTYIYLGHKYVDSILIADLHAKSVASYHSSAYYADLWDQTGAFTIQLMKNASYALSSLIYTAWVQAGSPIPWPDGINEKGSGATHLVQNYPNPVSGLTTIPLQVTGNNTAVSVQITDAIGNVKATLLNERKSTGVYNLVWDASGFPGGVYFVVMKADDRTETMKLMVIR